MSAAPVQTYAEAMAAKRAAKGKGKAKPNGAAAAPAAAGEAKAGAVVKLNANARAFKAAPPAAHTQAAGAAAAAAAGAGAAAGATGVGNGYSGLPAVTPVPDGEYDARSVPVDPWDARYVLNFDVSESGAMRRFFHAFGFVVVRDVLTAAECGATVGEVHDALERGTNGAWQRADPDTWNLWPANGMEHYASPSKPSIFSAQFLRNRTNPRVHRAFATLFAGGGADRKDYAAHDAADAAVTEQLLVNHDRCCFFRPTAQHAKWATKSNLHLDMNAWAWLGDGKALRTHLDALTYDTVNIFIQENNNASHADGLQLQAALNLMDNHSEDGGFVCVPGFHKEFDAYYGDEKLSGPPRTESANVNYGAKDPLQKRAVRVPMRAGSIVIWDQRLPHGSHPNLRTDRPRCAQFMKMFPARLVTAKRAQHRAAAVQRHIKAATADAKAAFGPFVIDALAHQLLGFNLVKGIPAPAPTPAPAAAVAAAPAAGAGAGAGAGVAAAAVAKK